jgi:hypothetical protein
MGVHPVQVSVHHVDQLLDLLIPLAAIEDGDPGELAQGLVDVVRVHFAAYNGDESLVLGPRVIELLPANRRRDRLRTAQEDDHRRRINRGADLAPPFE